MAEIPDDLPTVRTRLRDGEDHFDYRWWPARDVIGRGEPLELWS